MSAYRGRGGDPRSDASPGGVATIVTDRRGWVSTDEGAHLRGRRTQDTTPEVSLRRAVHALGLRYRLRRRIAGCRPDLVFPGRRVAVFVDGCFWHNCPQHGPKVFKGPNADRWRAKLQTNVARDRRNDKALRDDGWQVVRVWECEVRQSAGDAALRVARACREGCAGADRASHTFLRGHRTQSETE